MTRAPFLALLVAVLPSLLRPLTTPSSSIRPISAALHNSFAAASAVPDPQPRPHPGGCMSTMGCVGDGGDRPVESSGSMRDVDPPAPPSSPSRSSSGDEVVEPSWVRGKITVAGTEYTKDESKNEPRGKSGVVSFTTDNKVVKKTIHGFSDDAIAAYQAADHYIAHEGKTMVQRKIEGQTLADYNRQNPEKKVQLSEMKDHILQRQNAIGFRHNDVNPRNIMVDEQGKFKDLIDWDDATRLNHGDTVTSLECEGESGSLSRRGLRAKAGSAQCKKNSAKKVAGNMKALFANKKMNADGTLDIKATLAATGANKETAGAVGKVTKSTIAKAKGARSKTGSTGSTGGLSKNKKKKSTPTTPRSKTGGKGGKRAAGKNGGKSKATTRTAGKTRGTAKKSKGAHKTSGKKVAPKKTKAAKPGKTKGKAAGRSGGPKVAKPRKVAKKLTAKKQVPKREAPTKPKATRLNHGELVTRLACESQALTRRQLRAKAGSAQCKKNSAKNVAANMKALFVNNKMNGIMNATLAATRANKKTAGAVGNVTKSTIAKAKGVRSKTGMAGLRRTCKGQK
ncbi:hypothetical protein DFJ73DRAFT_902233 [Zopfochytrium polystomum]|nr:hypothetical protein DFJ73DRAFT_902233 [Zopfochytrium polystomum]